MITTTRLYQIAIIVLLILLYFTNCKGDKTAVAIPEVKGKFEAVKPVNKTVNLPIGQKLAKNDKSEFNRLQKEYNFTKQELEAMATEMALIESIADSLAYSENLIKEDRDRLVELLKSCSNVNEFSQSLSDDNIKIDVSGIIFKNIAERVKIDYTIKERTIETVVTKGLFIGGQIGSNQELNEFTYKIDADFLFKETIYKASFQKIGNSEFVLIGGSVKIF